MVSAELSYNPYLKEIDIRFNGHLPRVNSLVEKYRDEILQSWVDKIPGIFRDEMNGYGFELEFSGTHLDCQEIVNAFRDKGVTEQDVSIFHKTELAGRTQKLQNVKELRDWLCQNPNEHFDVEEFLKSNKEVLEGLFTFVVLHCDTAEEFSYEGVDISMDIIDRVEELFNTDLYHTPIVICLNENKLEDLQGELDYLLGRPDVTQEQIFFQLPSSLEHEQTKRFVKDLGIEKPQIIISVNDPIVKKYYELYPITDYICQMIELFQDAVGEISSVLEIKNKESELANREIYAQINRLEAVIEQLKEANGLFLQKTNFETPDDWKEIQKHFFGMIKQWKSRKIKIVKVDEANKLASDFDEMLLRGYRYFELRMSDAVKKTVDDIDNVLDAYYKTANYDHQYNPDIMFPDTIKPSIVPSIKNNLLSIKEERYVEQKEDILGKLFRQNYEDRNIELVMETVFNCQKWRDYVLRVAEPITQATLNEQLLNVRHYIQSKKDAYQNHLEMLLKQKTEKKESVLSQLSEDERRLQLDNDWLTTFEDRLKVIERG